MSPCVPASTTTTRAVRTRWSTYYSPFYRVEGRGSAVMAWWCGYQSLLGFLVLRLGLVLLRCRAWHTSSPLGLVYIISWSGLGLGGVYVATCGILRASTLTFDKSELI